MIKITDEEFIKLVEESCTYIDVIRKMGLSTNGAGNYTTIKSRIKRLNLDTTHFIGRGHNKNKTFQRLNTEEIFVENSTVARVDNAKIRKMHKFFAKKFSCLLLNPI